MNKTGEKRSYPLYQHQQKVSQLRPSIRFYVTLLVLMHNHMCYFSLLHHSKNLRLLKNAEKKMKHTHCTNRRWASWGPPADTLSACSPPYTRATLRASSTELTAAEPTPAHTKTTVSLKSHSQPQSNFFLSLPTATCRITYCTYTPLSSNFYASGPLAVKNECKVKLSLLNWMSDVES
jgi:hypothetical protein